MSTLYRIVVLTLMIASAVVLSPACVGEAGEDCPHGCCWRAGRTEWVRRIAERVFAPAEIIGGGIAAVSLCSHRDAVPRRTGQDASMGAAPLLI